MRNENKKRINIEKKELIIHLFHLHAASFLLEITHQKVFYFNGKKVEKRLIQRF